MKKMIKATGVICAAALAAAMCFSSLAETASTTDTSAAVTLGPVQFDGTVVSVEEDRFVMNRVLEGGNSELVVNVSDETRLLDGVNGYPISMDNLDVGETVRVYVGPAHDHEPAADFQRCGGSGGYAGRWKLPGIYSGGERNMGFRTDGWSLRINCGGWKDLPHQLLHDPASLPDEEPDPRG